MRSLLASPGYPTLLAHRSGSQVFYLPNSIQWRRQQCRDGDSYFTAYPVDFYNVIFVVVNWIYVPEPPIVRIVVVRILELKFEGSLKKESSTQKIIALIFRSS
jgi:hypothetical protein